VASLLDAPRPPTAIVAATDLLAAVVYRVAAERGLRVGKAADLAVTGCDGTTPGRMLSPSLTTVFQPNQEIARLVMEHLLAELDGPTGDSGTVVEASILEGDSA
jgi:LacI family transcriptional regulator